MSFLMQFFLTLLPVLAAFGWGYELGWQAARRNATD